MPRAAALKHNKLTITAILEYNKSIADVHMKKARFSNTAESNSRKVLVCVRRTGCTRPGSRTGCQQIHDYGWPRPKVVSLGTTDKQGFHPAMAPKVEVRLEAESMLPEEASSPNQQLHQKGCRTNSRGSKITASEFLEWLANCTSNSSGRRRNCRRRLLGSIVNEFATRSNRVQQNRSRLA